MPNEMTLQDLQADIWRSLPLRKVIAGRDTVNDLVQLAIEVWPAEYMNHAANDDERQVVAAEIERSVRRLHHACTNVDGVSYGILWAFVLQALVSLIIDRLLRWWLERGVNRVLMVAWQQELTQ